MANEAKWLLNELPKLRAEGILDETAASRLQSRYENTPKYREATYFLWMTSIIGTLLIASGAALFAHYNWGMLNPFLRLGIGGVPLALALCLGIVALIANSRALSECAALGNAVAAGVFYAIFQSVYHIDGAICDLALPILVASIPLIYVFNSSALAMLYSLGLFALIPSNLTYRMFLLLAVVPFILYHIKYNDPACVVTRYAALAVGIFGAVSFAGYYFPLYFFTLLVLFVFGGWEIYEKRTRHLANPWLLVPFGLFVALLAVAATCDKFYQLLGADQARNAAEFAEMRFTYWVATGGLLALLAVVFPRRRWDAKRVIPVILVLGMIYPLYHDFNAIWMRIFVTVFGILFAIALSLDGVRRRNSMLFNSGIVTFAVMVGCHFFNDSIHIYFRAGGLVLFGAAVIVANAVFAWRIHRAEKKSRAVETENKEASDK
ncbi:MAG: DUF2157 domain-containing protein [Victivallaceae bacterium]|nr:DUF2157 domain-containing protein [Victivallaceae bacterium]